MRMRVLLVIIVCAWSAAATPTTAIKVDQAGYFPQARKLAFVVSDQTAAEFLLRNARDSSVVFRGQLSPPIFDADSGDRIRIADFSHVQTQGSFYIDVPDVGRSWSFSNRTIRLRSGVLSNDALILRAALRYGGGPRKRVLWI